MHLQSLRQYIIIEVEKDSVSDVFNVVNEISKNVYMNPDSYIFEYYIKNTDQTIIIKPLISEDPLESKKDLVTPTLEKLLVDMLTDKDLFSSQQGQIENIFINAFKRYTINVSKMKRYAIRRNRENEIKNILNLIL